MKLYEALYPEIKWETKSQEEVVQVLLTNLKYPIKSKKKASSSLLYASLMHTDVYIMHKWRFIKQQIDRSGVPYHDMGAAIRAPEWVFSAMKVYNGDTDTLCDMQFGDFLARMHNGVSSGDLLARAHLLKSK